MTLDTGLYPPTKKRQPSKQARQRVRDAFDAEALKYLCTTWDFSDYAERIDLKPYGGRERFFYYANNDSPILAVAHLDSVQEDNTCQVTETQAGLLATSGALDDRLGVYVILDLLPKLGVTVDWLLTTDEEIGQSTAGEFDTNFRYNWMFQFDRGGTDVVMYDYETKALCELVEDSGARVGMGSFSDICMLEHLGCAGFNWGVGYQDYHGPRSHAWLEDTFRMVARFVKFYKANKDEHFEYTPRPFMPYGWRSSTVETADCGHAFDWEDADSYVERPDGKIDCLDCATTPDLPSLLVDVLDAEVLSDTVGGSEDGPFDWPFDGRKLA